MSGGDGRLFGTSGDSPYYLIPGRIGPDAIVYAGGLGHQIEFEMAVVRELGLTVFAFDPTNESASYLRRKRPDGIVYCQCGLSDKDESVSFVVKKKPSTFYNSVEIAKDHSEGIGSETFEVRRLPTLMKRNGHDRIDVLKIDIEGAEYAVLDDMIANGILPDQIALEWHYSYAGDGDSRLGIAKTQSYIEKLKALGYRVAFATRNDTEMTLVRDE